MKRESTIKFISKRLAMLVAFLAVYVMLALGGSRAAHAADGDFKGLLISPASNRIELGNGEVYTGEMNVQNSTDADMDVEMSVGSYSIENSNYGSPNYDNESKYSVMKDWIRLDIQLILQPLHHRACSMPPSLHQLRRIARLRALALLPPAASV